MMVNGKRIKNMEWVNFNILIKQNIMENGKEMSVKVTELIITQTEIDIKVNGIEIFKMELELITTQMVISIKASG